MQINIKLDQVSKLFNNLMRGCMALWILSNKSQKCPTQPDSGRMSICLRELVRGEKSQIRNMQLQRQKVTGREAAQRRRRGE